MLFLTKQILECFLIFYKLWDFFWIFKFAHFEIKKYTKNSSFFAKTKLKFFFLNKLEPTLYFKKQTLECFTQEKIFVWGLRRVLANFAICWKISIFCSKIRCLHSSSEQFFPKWILKKNFFWIFLLQIVFKWRFRMLASFLALWVLPIWKKNFFWKNSYIAHLL